jgi:hypothetical protein
VSQSNLGPAVVRIHLLESKPKQSLIECWSFTKRVTQMSTAMDTIIFFNSAFNSWPNRCEPSQQEGKPKQSWQVNSETASEMNEQEK